MNLKVFMRAIFPYLKLSNFNFSRHSDFYFESLISINIQRMKSDAEFSLDSKKLYLKAVY